MSAEVLREAAALMRERAEAATPGPWIWDGYHKEMFTGPQVNGCCAGDGWFDHWQDAEHIASWHPAVAHAVADLLDRAADDHDATPCPAIAGALAVARAYLNEVTS
jgi:hypothetical protein